MANIAPDNPVSCINCNTEYRGFHCPNCGQPANVRKLSIANLAQDLQERMFGLDARFLRTLKEAFKNPGHMSRAFIAGNRRRYFGPVGFFFIMLTLYLLSFKAFNLELSELVTRGSNISLSHSASDKQVEFTRQIADMFAYSFKALSFFTVFLSGFYIWVFNRYLKQNIVEHLVFAFYTDGIVYLLNIVHVFTMLFEKSVAFGLLSFLLNLVYFTFAYSTYDRKGSLFKRIMKAIAIRLLVTITLSVIVIVGMIIYALTHPELFE